METNKLAIRKLPKLTDLISIDEDKSLQNELMVLLNQEPPKAWVKQHPIYKNNYMSIDRIEFLLNSIFIEWNIEVLDVQLITNSIQVTIRLLFRNPLTGKYQHFDGVGAAPLQLNSGAKAIDYNELKGNSVMLATPIAKSYAIKDAANHLGKLFGRDLNRKESIDYSSMSGRFEPETKIIAAPVAQVIEIKQEIKQQNSNIKPEIAF